MAHAEHVIPIPGVTLPLDGEAFLMFPGTRNWNLVIGEARPGELIALVSKADPDLAQHGHAIHELQKALYRAPIGAEFDQFRHILEGRIAHLQQEGLARLKERSALEETTV